ncbi:nucleotide exchange factor GrpE [Aquimarina intermedia]|uniref:Protein GrpE n=1 Tax=Aquimarina intermedia TaxID=350814 RepID=A0A5S5BUR1_9FLAO|nr:nucleotide exchange factor GrpE [Aquimarina intermedia]TYP70905.1 molecular chaperone GrpE [Aquimarina intermedia]
MSKKNKQSEDVKDQEELLETTVEETVEDTQAVDEDKETQYKEELEKEKDKFLRLFAEFENYKRRTSKERLELFKTASQDVLSSMLPVMDDFDRAMKEIEKSEDENLSKGVALIHNKLRETLVSKGLTEMNVAAGDTFDADEHEAITQIPAPTADLKGKIVDVVEKGYKLGDRIIRFPKVVTGQ